MEIDGCTVMVERDPESGWVVGDVPELPGCHTQAPDMPALELALREANELYVETVNASDE